MTCKDCFHYKVCISGEVLKATFGFPDVCSQFKDKNKIIELPCNVGDYVFDISNGTPYKTKVLSFTVRENELTCRTISSFPNVESFGERIFLTEREAWEALKNG